MMQAGFIGLGSLGMAMAKRLIGEGVSLVVWNRTAEKAHELGAPTASSPTDLIAQVPVVFINIRDSAAVEEVLTREDGLLAGDISGKLIIDTTTNHFEAVTRFHTLVAARGGVYLEAPVAGSVVPASQGKLVVFASGEQTALEQARPYLEKISSSIVYFEMPGKATRWKLINNLVLGSLMAVLGEAVVLGEAAGFDKAQVLELLAAGAGNSGVLNAKRQKLLDEDFSPHFSVSMIHKDLRYLEDLADYLDQPVFLGAVVKQLFGAAVADGLGEQDFAAIYQTLK